MTKPRSCLLGGNEHSNMAPEGSTWTVSVGNNWVTYQKHRCQNCGTYTEDRVVATHSKD